MRVAIASDHGGFDQKAELAHYICALGHEVADLGTTTAERCDYPDYADKVARLVGSGKADRGVLICGTGIGMALAADKVPGVRAANIQTPEFARLFREHNDGNVLCLSGRFTSLELNEKIVKIFLTQAWEGGRHAVRVEKIMREDDSGFAGVKEQGEQEG